MFVFGGFTDSPYSHKQETRGLDRIQATSFFPWWLLLFLKTNWWQREICKSWNQAKSWQITGLYLPQITQGLSCLNGSIPHCPCLICVPSPHTPSCSRQSSHSFHSSWHSSESPSSSAWPWKIQNNNFIYRCITTVLGYFYSNFFFVKNLAILRDEGKTIASLWHFFFFNNREKHGFAVNVYHTNVWWVPLIIQCWHRYTVKPSFYRRISN